MAMWAVAAGAATAHIGMMRWTYQRVTPYTAP
jgi:hypothetical protein